MVRKGSWEKSSGLLLCFLRRIPYFVLSDHVLFISIFFFPPLQNAEANAESVLELRSEGLLRDVQSRVGLARGSMHRQLAAKAQGQHAQAAISQGTGILVL